MGYVFYTSATPPAEFNSLFTLKNRSFYKPANSTQILFFCSPLEYIFDIFCGDSRVCERFILVFRPFWNSSKIKKKLKSNRICHNSLIMLRLAIMFSSSWSMIQPVLIITVSSSLKFYFGYLMLGNTFSLSFSLPLLLVYSFYLVLFW